MPAKELADLLDCLAEAQESLAEVQESAANLIRAYEGLPTVDDDDDEDEGTTVLVPWQPGSSSSIGPLDMATLYPAGTMRPAMNKIAKFNEDQNLVFGWASIAASPDGDLVVDAHADVIEPVELEKAVYEYVLKFGDAGEMHQGESVGRLVESLIMTPDKASAMGIPPGLMPTGWWVGYHVSDPAVFAKVKSGEYPMFSIQGIGEHE